MSRSYSELLYSTLWSETSRHQRCRMTVGSWRSYIALNSGDSMAACQLYFDAGSWNVSPICSAVSYCVEYIFFQALNCRLRHRIVLFVKDVIFVSELNRRVFHVDSLIACAAAALFSKNVLILATLALETDMGNCTVDKSTCYPGECS